MIHPRTHSLWGAGNRGCGLNYSRMRHDQWGVRIFLQCVRIRPIALFFDED